jgi:glucose-6-phosphate isomerase
MSRISREALSANAQALAGEGRMSLSLVLDTLDAYTLGALFYFAELAVAYEGALAGVNAYDQPGVEAYKKILHENLQK